MKRVLRCLRIAFSATCLIACVLLTVLWVRTRYAIDSFSGPLSSSAGFSVMSRHGGIGLLFSDRNQGWSYYEYPRKPTAAEIDAKIQYHTVLGFVRYKKEPGAFRIRVPYWSLILVSAAFSGLPWIRWRFTLRTLLITTTLVAVLMGLCVYFAR